MSAELHYFRCRICSTVKVVSIKSPRMERCTCRSIMRFLFSVPIETEEQRAIAKRGIVYNPHQEIRLWVCVRCGSESSTVRPIDRVDGLCCRACYEAEEHPPLQLLTPEEIVARQAERTDRRRADDDRQEQAYSLAEQEQRQ